MSFAIQNSPTHIHDIVIHNKRGSFRFRLVANANLPYATIAPEEVIQVLTSDLVIQVLNKQNAVCTWRKLGLEKKKEYEMTLLECESPTRSPSVLGLPWS